MLEPGFAVIHSNQLETLRDVLVAWMKDKPLAPLANEDILVQSNGIAQWLKMALAETGEQGVGIAAGLRVELPNQFIWRLYRAVLGNEIPASLPYDKPNLRWRLLRLLPQLEQREEFARLTRYLANDSDGRKTWHLAERLADLFDQYQVYRADWLNAWSMQQDVLLPAGTPLPAEQLWQAALWRLLRDDMEQIAAPAQFSSRADVHEKALKKIALGQFAHPEQRPQRVLVFGISSLPEQTLQLLAALGQHCQVLLAVLNPSQHFWGDLQTVKDWQKRALRHPLKTSWADPAFIDQLHLHSPQLLASWGKQGRDYIDLLAKFDEPSHYQAWFGGRIDLFHEPLAAATETSVLLQLQQDILNLDPLPTEKRRLFAHDQSISFHRCYSRQREVEVLQDNLLQAFLADPDLRARDVIVMTPDISQYAPHIDAVFGGIAADDKRYLSYSLADQQGRGQEPLLIALEYLLTIEQQQIRLSDVLDLLDVPAIQAQFGLEPSVVPQLRQWLNAAGVRWGLDAGHRQKLGITAMDDAFSWAFGVERLLLGYAMGEANDGQDVEWQERLAYTEVAGLGAEQLGPVLSFVHVLHEWFENLHQQPQRTLTEWLLALQSETGLLNRCFDFTGEQESRLYTRLIAGLERLETGAQAGQFTGLLPLSILREAWLAEVEQTGLSQRFMAGSITFSTLLPMRAIPFKRIYILGMNDGEYPRSRRPDDFDLMAHDYRPGDRSRRDDDRYLFLEALLSARQAVYYSWVGFNIQDSTERPPSVLLAQMMDVLQQGWSSTEDKSPLQQLLHDYPLQPFSARYFGAKGLPTFSYEWERLFSATAASDLSGSSSLAAKYSEASQRQDNSAVKNDESDTRLTHDELVTLLKQPVDFYLQQRLKARLYRQADPIDDNEPFTLSHLDMYLLQNEALTTLARDGELDHSRLANKWRKSGVLPYGVFGERALMSVMEGVSTVQERFRLFQQHWQRLTVEQSAKLLPNQLQGEGFVLTPSFAELWQKGGELSFLVLRPSAILEQDALRWSKLIPLWLQMQYAALAGVQVQGYILGFDTAWHWLPPTKAEAEQNMLRILAFQQQAFHTPLAVNAALAEAWLRSQANETNEARARSNHNNIAEQYEGGPRRFGEVQKSPALQRYYPDYKSFEQAGFVALAEDMYVTLHAAALQGGKVEQSATGGQN